MDGVALSHPGNNVHPVVRPVSPEDQGFIAKGFARQLADCHVPSADRMTAQQANAAVDRVLDSKIVKILVAVVEIPKHDHDRIIGWIAYVPSFTLGRLIVYVYTRDQYRGHGVGRALLDAAFPKREGRLIHTFNGPDAKSLLAKFQSRHVKFEELL